jgi:hypothetical protein
MRRKLWAAGTFAGVVVAALVVGLVVRPEAGPSRWTGLSVEVPSCPTDADGCRVVAVPAGETASFTDPSTAHEDWSGSASTVEMTLSVGTYSVSAEGCAGYAIAPTTVTVTEGAHVTVLLDPGGFWDMPGFLDRTCPGFHAASSAPVPG